MEGVDPTGFAAGLVTSRLALLIVRLVGPPLEATVLTSWECPQCGRVVWTRAPAPRCARCGFWDTKS